MKIKLFFTAFLLLLASCDKENNTDNESQINDSSQHPGYNEEHWTWDKKNNSGLLFDTNQKTDSTLRF